jgi:hypothetical protein
MSQVTGQKSNGSEPAVMLTWRLFSPFPIVGQAYDWFSNIVPVLFGCAIAWLALHHVVSWRLSVKGIMSALKVEIRPAEKIEGPN